MPQATSSQAKQAVAALDLGSNSFHMLVARVVDDHLDVIDRLRERVALAEGMGEDRRLDPQACDRALACLRRFGQRISHLDNAHVRAVGTNTLRRAKYARRFLSQCEKALGHPIEIVAGNEEARLIYSGVVHSLPSLDGRKLVIDIGGGSTECIIGDALEPIQVDSLQMGCVSFSESFFKKGKVDKASYENAVVAAASELQSIQTRYRELSWKECYGCSGTIRAVGEILRTNNWLDNGSITLQGVKRLSRTLIETKSFDEFDIPGLSDERTQVITGGVAIIQALFESLGIEEMQVSDAALREGLLYDVIGRIHHEDIRQRTIQRFVERYHVDLAQAQRVEQVALALLNQIAVDWNLDLELSSLYLSWAAKLHEIGLSVAYSGYRKHSAYLVENSYMPGFSREDQDLLAFLVLNHRRKPRLALIENIAEERADFATKLCAILRIAVCLCHSRNSAAIGPINASASSRQLKISFGPKWLEKQPLTRYDLENEITRLRKLDVQLSID